MQIDLSGKVALVTGSTSGMGQAIARALALNGAAVAVHGLGDTAANTAFADALRHESGKETVLLENDLACPAATEAMIDEVLARFGRLDILINNAGIQHRAPIHEFPTAAWKALLDVNLTAPFIATRRVVPYMIKQSWGRIINTSSTLGLVAEKHKAAYVATKHGLIGLTRAVALDVADSGITCNAICPGWVLTPLAESQVETAVVKTGKARDVVIREDFLALQPSGRFVTVEEIAGAVLYLCSDAAASVTGVALPVDGGQLVL